MSVSQDVSIKLNRKEREIVVAWLAEHQETLPEPVQRLLAEPLAKLTGAGISQKDFNHYNRQLARALGFIPSSERRRPSGRPLDGVKLGGGRSSNNERERLERQRNQLQVRVDRDRRTLRACAVALARLNKGEDDMPKDTDSHAKDIRLLDPDIHQRPPTQQEQAEIEQSVAETFARLDLGDAPDPTLVSSTETLMNADVVCIDEDQVLVPAELPEEVSEDDVVKTLVESRTRYDFAVTVTRVQLDVEKKIVVTPDGTRRVFSGSVHEYGPKGFAVTWQALATLAVLIGQFALPLNRLGTMLSTATKKFTSTSLGRMAHYVAERFVPIYLVLMEQLADSEILAGDDTSCRVVEVSSYFSRAAGGPTEAAPWAEYASVEAAQRTYLESLKRKMELLVRRAAGERDAKNTSAPEPALKVLVGRELAFESQRRQGGGSKRSLNTTVVSGRTDAEDPRSLVVFYRSHLGSFGNLLEMLLSRRKPSAKKVTVQSDLSTTNLVADPQLTSRFEIGLVGCSAHARRPFAQYEDQDPTHAPVVLEMFRQIATHETALDRLGRNQENTVAVRSVDSRACWDIIKKVCERMLTQWTKATPLGTAARYILSHFTQLTAYLTNPRLEPTNNLRERMLRTEKLIEKSSLFRRSIEGRVVLDILRTILQTAVAAGVPPHRYLVSVMKAAVTDVEDYPERYTPLAWAKHHPSEQESGERQST